MASNILSKIWSEITNRSQIHKSETDYLIEEEGRGPETPPSLPHFTAPPGPLELQEPEYDGQHQMWEKVSVILCKGMVTEVLFDHELELDGWVGVREGGISLLWEWGPARAYEWCSGQLLMWAYRLFRERWPLPKAKWVAHIWPLLFWKLNTREPHLRWDRSACQEFPGMKLLSSSPL